jgi:hypothetical protein
MPRPLGKHNGEYAWSDSEIAQAYSLICLGRPQAMIIADAVQSEVPEISRTSLIRYITYFSTKYNYPPPKKGMSLPWEGFTYDKTPLWEPNQILAAYQMVVDGRKTDDILRDARAAELPRINTKIFWKYMSWISKEAGIPFPRKRCVFTSIAGLPATQLAELPVAQLTGT